MAKAKVKAVYICKYCGAKTPNISELCGKCREKKKIMQGWHWLYKGQEIIKENKRHEKK